MRTCFYIVLVLPLALSPAAFAQPQFELENNWLQWMSFVTGQDEGMEQNLDDNLGWMQSQGYTHLRFFGIYPNGLHAFPSPTLDANGYPTNPLFESVLPVLVSKAGDYGIVVNFDGWEVIAESNRDTTQLGVGYMTEDEVADVVREVLGFGVSLISEEQFGGSYLRAIQTATQEFDATHETTAGVWWIDPTIADAQLASVFTFYHYNQDEADSLALLSSRTANLGVVHIFAEGAQYYGIPFSLAVGSFGFLEAENWRNVLLFAQLQHLPERFSIEETDTDFTIWNPAFNFMEYVGDEIVSLASEAVGDRPIANYVLDSSTIPLVYIRPVFETVLINAPAVANTFTALGYRVVTTIDSVLPEAESYFVALAGGAGSTSAAPLPDYVLPLLTGDAAVFVHPAYGIPDENDEASWTPLREFFGLPTGDTETLAHAVPETVDFDGETVRWGGIEVTLAACLERIPKDQVDTTVADVPLSGWILGQDIALLLQRGTKFLINSNVIHLESSYILADRLGGPLNAPAAADVVVADGRALIYAEYDCALDLDLPWSGETRVRRYEPQGSRIQDETVPMGGSYTANLQRGEFVFLVDAATSSLPEQPAGSARGRSVFLAAYPNPLGHGTTIQFVLDDPARVRLSIHTVTGQLVRKLASAVMDAGIVRIPWDGRSERGVRVPPGVYFCRLEIGGSRYAARIVVLR